MAGAVEIVDVTLEEPPPVVTLAPAPAPAALAAAPQGGPTLVYLFVPGSVRPRALEAAFAGQLAGAEVTAFGSWQDFEQALQARPPHAVVATRTALDALGLPVTLQGLDASGSANERYVLLSDHPLGPGELGGAAVGTVDLAGRERSTELVKRLVGAELVGLEAAGQAGA
ncbi:MAG: hypothetical protein R3F59_17140 [Myxococcota bacterium]